MPVPLLLFAALAISAGAALLVGAACGAIALPLPFLLLAEPLAPEFCASSVVTSAFLLGFTWTKSVRPKYSIPSKRNT